MLKNIEIIFKSQFSGSPDQIFVTFVYLFIFPCHLSASSELEACWSGKFSPIQQATRESVKVLFKLPNPLDHGRRIKQTLNALLKYFSSMSSWFLECRNFNETNTWKPIYAAFKQETWKKKINIIFFRTYTTQNLKFSYNAQMFYK